MANTTISPNMSLPVPTVGEDPGPDWASNYNACMSAIDSHNHSSGQGVAITPDGININNNFPMNNNNITAVKNLIFQPQVVSAANLGSLEEIGVDLYYTDGSGNSIRITQSGSVTGSAGTITGLPSGTASASFAAGTFTFQAATNTPAAINGGPLTIGQAVVSGFGVTISASVSQASNYNMSLPTALPASTKIMTLDSSGNIGDSYDVDNVTIEVSSSNLQVKDGGISTAKIADSAVTLVKTTGPTTAHSNTSGSFSSTSTSFTTVSSLGLTPTLLGNRTVMISIVPDGSAGGSSARASAADCTVRVRRAATTTIGASLMRSGSSFQSMTFFDFPSSSGPTNYEIQVAADPGGTAFFTGMRLVIQEF